MMTTTMRTTVRIEDDLLRELKAQARRQNVPMTRLLNRALRAGLRAARPRRRALYREQTYAMGVPGVELDKALGVAAALEDEEILRKLALRK